MGKSFNKCPKGHKLPRVTKKGQCTPLDCADDAKEKVVSIVKKEKAPPPVVFDDEDEDELADSRKKLKLRASQREARRELIPAPELEGTDAENWADQKIVKLLPKAVAELEYQLEYGSDEQRERAANKILDATGRGKTERGGAGTAPIILLNMAPGQVPWAQRVDKKDLPVTLEAKKDA